MERFFISGCQRSGTTMLRLVLESHPAVLCCDEAVGYDILVRESRGERCDTPVKEGATLLGFKIPRFTEQLLWTEFVDPDYGVFPSFYQDQKVIHIVRDPLDVVGSMMKLKTEGGASWLDRYGRSILQSLIGHPNIRSQYRQAYAALERQGLPLHLVGALYWQIKNQGLLDLLEHNKPVCAVRYESLAGSPAHELSKIVRFLGVGWSDTLLNHPGSPHAEIDENGLAIGETDPLRTIDMRSIGGHRQVMSALQIQEVRDFVTGFSKKIDSAITP